MHKAEQNTAPTYTGSGSNNYGVCTCIYKNSTTDATTYSRSSGMTQATFNSSKASSQATNVIRFKSATQMSVFVAASSYGLLANTSYTYHVIYSA